MTDAVDQVFEPVEEAIEQMNVSAVFGEPVKEGDVTIIPVAEVNVMFGYGYGFGEGPTDDDETEMGVGGGAGGGARGRATPRGYIRITPEGVCFESIENETTIPLAGIAMVAWSVFWVMKTIRTIAGIFARN
jgi:uncharacterized spore protein YtfJ